MELLLSEHISIIISCNLNTLTLELSINWWKSSSFIYSGTHEHKPWHYKSCDGFSPSPHLALLLKHLGKNNYMLRKPVTWCPRYFKVNSHPFHSRTEQCFTSACTTLPEFISSFLFPFFPLVSLLLIWVYETVFIWETQRVSKRRLTGIQC